MAAADAEPHVSPVPKSTTGFEFAFRILSITPGWWTGLFDPLSRSFAPGLHDGFLSPLCHGAGFPVLLVLIFCRVAEETSLPRFASPIRRLCVSVLTNALDHALIFAIVSLECFAPRMGLSTGPSKFAISHPKSFRSLCSQWISFSVKSDTSHNSSTENSKADSPCFIHEFSNLRFGRRDSGRPNRARSLCRRNMWRWPLHLRLMSDDCPT